jgi:ribosome biogenesis GTPase / thiamine phosphate phosphatase
MDRSEKRHRKDIQKHVDYETMKLRKQAGKLRRSLKKTKGSGGKPVTEENWEQVVEKRKTRGRPSRNELVDELRASTGETPAQSSDVDKNVAIVIFVASGRCRVFRDGQEIDCIIPPEVAVRQQSALAVGDRVQLDENRAVKAVLPRRTVLSRPDPNNPHRQRLIAANLDIVIHVVSVKAPPLRPRLIDRFFIAIQRGGAQPLLCVNKIDLMTDERELAQLEPYRELMPVVLCSTKSGEGLDALRMAVQGKTCALVGHSGVGKSSILNALDRRLELATADVHKGGTGRHTTTASTLFDLGGGTYLIDTPGIREFGLWDLQRDTLRDYFPEFAEAAEWCRFNDCSHLHEPDCEVKRRVERGEISRARYETYARLAADLASERG